LYLSNKIIKRFQGIVHVVTLSRGRKRTQLRFTLHTGVLIDSRTLTSW